MFVSLWRATTVNSPPSSYSFRALLEEEENRLIKAGQAGAQRSHGAQGSHVPAAARKVTFKGAESGEPERPAGWVRRHSSQEHDCRFPLGGSVGVSTDIPSHKTQTTAATDTFYTRCHINSTSVIGTNRTSIKGLFAKCTSHTDKATKW